MNAGEKSHRLSPKFTDWVAPIPRAPIPRVAVLNLGFIFRSEDGLQANEILSELGERNVQFADWVAPILAPILGGSKTFLRYCAPLAVPHVFTILVEFSRTCVLAAMPTALPPPRNWQAFEDLCCDLWRELWRDPEAQKNGRGGQAQAGVDIVGHDAGAWVGIQCKHKGRRAGLNRAEIEKEVEKARSFAPPLAKLLIATTAPSDTAAQQIAREISDRHRKEKVFSVTIVSWDDILLHLANYPSLVAKHYPDLASAFQTGAVKSASEQDLLELWLCLVAADHSQLTPYFQRQPEIGLLQRVYVELQLTSATSLLQRFNLAETGAPRELRALLELDSAVHPWMTRRWVILGDPGAGKTTLLRHFAAALALEPVRRWVPVFQSLPKLLRGEEFLLDPIGRRVERLGHSGEQLKALLEQLGRKGRLLVLLDGLDEVPRPQRDEAEEILRGLADRWPDSPLVVTSRPIGYRLPGTDFLELTLLPFDRGRRRDFLARWLGRATGVPDEARAAMALAVLESPELRELAGNPLYLTLMALLYESGVEPNRNRTRLYDQVFQLLFEGRHHGPHREPLEAQETVRAVLRRLAYAMTDDNRDTEPVTALETRLRSRQFAMLRMTLGQVAGWSKIRQFLDDLAEKTGILGPHDGPDADWRFWHRTFREALTAEQLAEDYKRERTGLLSRLRSGRSALPARARKVTTKEDLDGWTEPFALLVGHVENPDNLVRALVRKNRPLGLRALATAQGLSEETFDEILALTDDWQQRKEVFQSVPYLVDEPGRALALLDRLRRRTRNGNDLYFLEWAVQGVADRAPEAAREAAEIRAGFFSHIPRPSEDLFRWIDTPLDGRVPLWREIPEGKFSRTTQGEETTEGWWLDRPRKEITSIRIAVPFRLGAVPVTNAQYAAFDPDHEAEAQEDVSADEIPYLPVGHVTWFEACSFCNWLASFPWAHGARLPTQEEWEYACSAGSQSRYWNGDDEKDLAEVGWYDANSGGRTHRVGEKPANPWGLYDVHGNVREWALSGGRTGLNESSVEVCGGSYWNLARGACTAYRISADPKIEVGFQGFRVLIPADPKPLSDRPSEKHLSRRAQRRTRDRKKSV